MIALWWVWIVAGIALAILEIFVPGFVFLGFAVGAVVTGITLWLTTGLAPATILLIFAVASLVAWLVMRQVAGVRRGQVKVWDRDINED